MKKNLEQQEKELEEKYKAFEAEREAWEEQNRPDDQYVLYYCPFTLVPCVLQFEGPDVMRISNVDNHEW